MEPRDPDLYREAFRETVNPTVIADTDLVITDVNEAAREFTGYDRGELIGSTPRRLVNDERVYAGIVETVRRGDPWVGEFESLTRDGRVVHGRGSVSPLVLDGATEGYVMVFTDTTRRRRYEESLRVLNRVLRHNLRNDANVVLGHVERVADEVADAVDGPEAARLLDSLDTAAGRVDDMLDRARTTRRFSGVLAGEHGTLRPVNLGEAVREAVGDTPTADVTVDDRVDDSLTVLADGTLVSALQAVIENAVEHNDKPRPHLDLSAGERGDRVVLSVADNGPGIDPARHDEIFGYGEHTQVEHGEGLSLFFVDRLMEMYGGEVAVRPNEPEGTVFELRFRRPKGDAAGRAAGAAGRAEDVSGRALLGDARPDPPDAAGDPRGRTDGAGRAEHGRHRTDRDWSSPTSQRREGSNDRSGRDRRPPTDGVAGERGGRGARAGDPRTDYARRTDPGEVPEAAAPDDAAYPEGSTGSDEGDAADPSDLIDHVEPGAWGSPADDPAVAATADAVGPSVTPARLRGDVRGYPAVLDALPAHERPHHLLRLRPGDPVDAEGDLSFRGDATAVFTDTAAVVVVDGDQGGRLSVPYDSLTAVGRRRDALVLFAGERSHRLHLPRAHAADDAVAAAVSFLERELR